MLAKIGWQNRVEGWLHSPEQKEEPLPIEALKIKLDGPSQKKNRKTAKLSTRLMSQTYGWQNEVANGALSGTTEKPRELKAVCYFTLEGAIADKYDVY